MQSYEEMENKIIKYATNKEYCQAMSNKAKKRADVLLNTSKELNLIIEKIESNPLFL